MLEGAFIAEVTFACFVEGKAFEFLHPPNALGDERALAVYLGDIHLKRLLEGGLCLGRPKDLRRSAGVLSSRHRRRRRGSDS